MSGSEDAKETTAELDQVGRALATLALARMRQDGRLLVRQREELRRAMATAGQAMGWTRIAGSTADRMAKAERDLAALAAAGVQALERDLAHEMADKKVEVDQIRQTARSVQKLAGDEDTEYPAEIAYSHTARHGSRQLVTKTEVLTLSDADEAQSAAATLEKRLESWAKLRDLMLEDLKEGQRQIREMKGTLTGFLDGSRGLVGEVLATLY